MKRRIIEIAAITLIHAALSMVVFLRDFSLGMRRFDTGADPTTLERVIHTTSQILFLPLFTPFVRHGGNMFHQVFGGILGYVPLLLNSLVWGTAIWITWELIQRRRRTEPAH
jgi:hypothetical protein